MRSNPFIILGVSENCTQAELERAYHDRRSLYVNERFSLGEMGSYACEKLDEIDVAYKEAKEILESRYYVDTFDNRYKGIEDKIRNNDVDGAQFDLDRIPTRDAHWHFLQSMVYYKKRFYVETKKQLETALTLDPTNSTYQDAYNNLNAKHFSDSQKTQRERPQPNRESFYNNNYNQSDRSYKDTTVDGANNSDRVPNPCSCCTSLLCADCLCECCGGDLISCC
ncbi:MAG: hypothetical protein LBF68_00875 [Christensenellaceae bacterium]|jgi:hypothetical protein|nr:hypothetical protein [Christensenellaceae bacterium]